MCCCFPHVQVTASWVESMFSWSYFQAVAESCHHQCLKAVCGGFWGILQGQRYFTSIFTMRFHLGLYPGSEMVVVKGEGLVNQEDSSQRSVLRNFGSRAFNAEEVEKIAPPPSSEGEGGEVGVPRNLFHRLGFG